MAGKSFLRDVAGRFVEFFGVQTSAGAANAGDIPALGPDGRFDQSLLPDGVGETGTSMTASETVAAGDLINVHDSSGQKVRKADATSAGKEASGFVEAGINAAASGTVYWGGIINGLSGLTPGARYYLSTTPGAITATAPSASGNIVQFVGVALSATELLFTPGPPITKA